MNFLNIDLNTKVGISLKELNREWWIFEEATKLAKSFGKELILK